MSDEGKPIQPEHVLKKVIWRSTLELSETMEQATTWTITGIAAISGLFISNLDSMGKLVRADGLRWSLIFFTTSLVAGALSKQVGMAITKGLAMIQKIEGLLATEQGQALMSQMATPPKQLIREIADPFYWPLSWMMRRSGIEGMKDYLSADKRFVRLFCAQLVFLYLHGILATAGFLAIACSIIG
jgi:hypothetical protein